MITRVPTFTVEKDLYVNGKIYLGSVDILTLFAAIYAPSDAEYVTTLADPAIPNAVVLTGTAGQIVVTPGVGTVVLSLDAAGAGAGITTYVRDVTLDAQGRVTALTTYGAAPQVALSAGVGTVPLFASNTIRSLSNTSEITVNDAGGTTAVNFSLASQAVTPAAYDFATVTVTQKGVVSAIETGAAAGTMGMGLGTPQVIGTSSGWVTVTTPYTGALVIGNISATVASGIFTVTRTGLYRYAFQMPLFKSGALSGGTGAFFIGPSVNGGAPGLDYYYPLYDTNIPTGVPTAFIGSGVIYIAAGQTFGIQVSNGFTVGTVTVAQFNGHMSLDRVA